MEVFMYEKKVIIMPPNTIMDNSTFCILIFLNTDSTDAIQMKPIANPNINILDFMQKKINCHCTTQVKPVITYFYNYTYIYTYIYITYPFVEIKNNNYIRRYDHLSCKFMSVKLTISQQDISYL